jgi:plastocyanin
MTSTDIEKVERDEPDQPGTDLVSADKAGGGPPGPPHTALLEPSASARGEAFRTRVLLPLLLPIVSAGAIAFFVLNLSRALLAGGDTGSLVIASIVAVSILGGAAWISSQPQLSTGALAMVLAVFLLLIAAGGLTGLGPSQPAAKKAAAGFAPPKGPPVGTLTVQAGAGGQLRFDPSALTATAGVNQIDLTLGAGLHTFVFTDPKLRGFQLNVGGKKTSDTGKVDLAAGTYTFYCTIPGHRAAGMEGTITVTG